MAMEGKGQEQSFLSFLWSNMQFEKLDIHTNKMEILYKPVQICNINSIISQSFKIWSQSQVLKGFFVVRLV